MKEPIPENVKPFLNELKTLIEKYGIEITASDEWEGYSECGEDIQIRIESTIGSSEYFSIPFGKSIDANDIEKALQ
jgi:hypothetical protein